MKEEKLYNTMKLIKSILGVEQVVRKNSEKVTSDS